MDNKSQDLARKIISELEKLSHTVNRIVDYLAHAPRQHDVKSINEHGEADQRTQKHGTRQIDSGVPPQATPPHPEADKATKEWYQAVPWWKVLEATGIVAAVWYAAITYCQWQDLRHNFVADQRAWVSVAIVHGQPPFSVGNPIAIPIRIVNTGKTPALRASAVIVVAVLNRGGKPDFVYAQGHPRVELTIPLLVPNDPMTQTFKALRLGPGATGLIILTAEIQRALELNQIAVLAHGKITYSDIFGQEHWTTFCAQSQGGVKGDGASDPEGTISSECTQHNDIDR